MNITKGNKIGMIDTDRKATIKAYKSNPGNFDAAVYAAYAYTKKHNENMVVIPGNSYMNRVFHIAKESDSLLKYTVCNKEAKVGYVNVDGIVFDAIASE